MGGWWWWVGGREGGWWWWGAGGEEGGSCRDKLGVLRQEQTASGFRRMSMSRQLMSSLSTRPHARSNLPRRGALHVHRRSKSCAYRRSYITYGNVWFLDHFTMYHYVPLHNQMPSAADISGRKQTLTNGHGAGFHAAHHIGRVPVKRHQQVRDRLRLSPWF